MSDVFFKRDKPWFFASTCALKLCTWLEQRRDQTYTLRLLFKHWGFVWTK